MTTTIPKQETCTPPSERVPIMIEITKDDSNNAGPFEDIHNCIVATALKRCGYKDVSVGGRYLSIGGESYFSGDISSFNIGNYKKAVGKQIILYPK